MLSYQLGQFKLTAIPAWRISPAFWEKTIWLVILLAVFWVVMRLAIWSIDQYRKLLLRNEAAHSAEAKRVATISLLLKNALLIVGVVFSGYLILTHAGVNLAPLIAGAGVIGVAVGFGAQNLIKDWYYGLFILLENQFVIGDTIQIGTVTGTVEKLTLRTVALRDLSGRMHIFPTSEASKVIVYTHGWAAMNLNVEVDYKTNLDHLFQVIAAVNEQISNDYPHLLIDKPENFGVEDFGQKGLVVKIVAKTPPQKQWELTRLYRKHLKDAFDASGIEIPVIPPVLGPTA